MSLTDLKRRKKKAPQTHVSVEDFIEDANNYAFGQPSEVSKSRKKIRSAKHKGINKHSTKIYKHATFSLTENAIEILDAIATDTKLAKSKLIRILIHDFATKNKREQNNIIASTEE